MVMTLFSYAQKVDTTLNISGVEVVAEKSLSVDKISINDNERSSEDAGQVLKKTPNINIIKRGNYATDPVIRGFKADQLQLLTNGFVQTNPACPNRMDAPSSHINLEDLETIEIVKGPYSVRYGMNTGGVVNFVGKELSATEQLKFNARAGFYYHTNGANKDGQVGFTLTTKKFGLKFSGGMKDFGNYKSGDGTEILSSFKHKDYGVTAGWFINAHNKILLDWNQSFAEDVLFAALPMDGDYDNSSTGALRYLYHNANKKINRIELKAYGNWIDHQMSNSRRPNTVILDAVSNLQSQTMGGRGELNYKISNEHNLLLGVDYKAIGKQGNRERRVYKNPCTGMVMDPPAQFTDAIWQDSKQNDFGVFAESKWYLNKNWLWKAGLRLDMVSSDIKDPAGDFKALYTDLGKTSDMAFMANSRLQYHFTDESFLEWSIGYGQRAPELIERYINHLAVGMDAYEYVGNPNLKMEQNFQNDLKFKLEKQKFQIEASVFYSLLSNYIQANLDTTLSRKYSPCMEPKFAKRYENVDQALMYGGELMANVNVWKALNVYGSWAYTVGENVTMDEPLAEIPPMEINTGLKYLADKWSATFNARFVSAQDRVSVSFNESTSSAFNVFNFSAHYNIWKGFNIVLNVENIFDENYVEHLSRAYKNQTVDGVYFEPGRNIIMGLTYKL